MATRRAKITFALKLRGQHCAGHVACVLTRFGSKNLLKVMCEMANIEQVKKNIH